MGGLFARQEKPLAALVFALACYLLFVNLGGAALWHDEAGNAGIARHLLQTGGYNGWNGRNLLHGNNGSLLNENLRAVSYPPWPPLPSAAGMALFGDNEFGVRVFHSALGAIALVVFFALLRLEFGGAQLARLRLCAFALFALGAQTLLFMRQGRYYADAIAFSLLAFYFYRLYWRGGARANWFLAACVVFTVLNFAVHYAIGAAFALAMAAWHVLFYARQTARAQWLAFAAAGAAAAAACLALLYWHGVLGGEKALEFDESVYQHSWLERRVILIYWYFRDLLRFGWLPLWVAVWLVWATATGLRANKSRRGKKKKRKENKEEAASVAALEMNAVWRHAALAFLFLFFSALISVQIIGSISESRYWLAAPPFLATVCAGFVCWLASAPRFGGALAACALVALLCSNLLAQPFAYANVRTQDKFWITLPALVGELHAPYPSAAREVASYLRQNAKQDDAVYALPWYDNDLLLYYLNDKLVFCCSLDKKSGLPEEKVRALGAPLYTGDATPTWLAVFAPSAAPDKRYELVFESDAYFYPTQRPELERRVFGGIVGHSPRGRLYRLRKSQ